MPKGLKDFSDTIKFKSIDTGGNKAGNGGDGYNSGDITNKPTLKFDPTNKAEGSDVKVNQGDDVHQKAYWDADGGDATAKKFSKAYGGDAKSNGDQTSKTGDDAAKVYANTEASQLNFVLADQHQDVKAGNGGDGGDDNWAHGGDVNFHL
jgi:hypothetical protein